MGGRSPRPGAAVGDAFPPAAMPAAGAAPGAGGRNILKNMLPEESVRRSTGDAAGAGAAGASAAEGGVGGAGWGGAGARCSRAGAGDRMGLGTEAGEGAGAGGGTTLAGTAGAGAVAADGGGCGVAAASPGWAGSAGAMAWPPRRRGITSLPPAPAPEAASVCALTPHAMEQRREQATKYFAHGLIVSGSLIMWRQAALLSVSRDDSAIARWPFRNDSRNPH